MKTAEEILDRYLFNFHWPHWSKGNAIKAMHEFANQWISVEDELPETNTIYESYYSSVNVLCLMQDGTYEIAQYQESDVNNWQGWYNPIMDDATDVPKYWMPLPNKPL